MVSDNPMPIDTLYFETGVDGTRRGVRRVTPGAGQLPPIAAITQRQAVAAAIYLPLGFAVSHDYFPAADYSRLQYNRQYGRKMASKTTKGVASMNRGVRLRPGELASGHRAFASSGGEFVQLAGNQHGSHATWQRPAHKRCVLPGTQQRRFAHFPLDVRIEQAYVGAAADAQ